MVNKNIISLGIVSFFTDMASSMVSVILPIFIVYTLDEGVDKLGYVVALATFVSYAFRILFGYLSDRLQVVKPFVVSGYVISALSKPLLYLSGSWQSVALLRGVERVGKAVRSATKDSLISAYSDGKSGKSFGFHKMMDIAGELTGSLIVFALLFFVGESEKLFREIFLATIIPGALSVIVVIFFVKDVEYKKESKKFDLSQDYHLLPLLFVYFAFIFFMFNDSFFIIKAKEAGIGVEYIPLLIVLLNLTQTLLSYGVGIKVDTLGVVKVLGIAFGFGVLSIWFLYIDWIVLGFVALGVFTIGSLNAMRAYISDKAYNKATIYGVFYAGVAVCSSLGALVTGWIWHYMDVDTAMMFSLGGMVMVSICMMGTKTHHLLDS